MSRKSFFIPIVFVLIIIVIVFALPVKASQFGQQTNPPERLRPDQYAYNGPETMGNLPVVNESQSFPSQFTPGAIVPWSRIVFESYRDMNWEIYTANGDGSNPTRLTVDAAIDMQPRLNRGCTRIVFSSSRAGNFQLFSMNPDGSGLTQLTNYGADSVYPYWSPDGTRIVFQSYLQGQADIYVINSDGSNLTRLTTDANYDGMPSWSPEGSRIAFVSYRSGGYRVWVMNADGSNPTLLSSQVYSETPIFSPDGNKILYDGDVNGDGWQDLLVMNTDGSNQQLIRGNQSQIDDWANTWSPDNYYRGFTEVNFIYQNGQWYWTSGVLHGLDPSGGSWVTLNPYSYTEWNFDWQTTDNQTPVSKLSTLPFASPASFTVSWSGNDIGESGLKDFDVQYKDIVDGAWTDWRMSTTDTSAVFTGLGGHTYFFRVRAVDHAYNKESWPATYDGMTFVENLPPVTKIQSLLMYSPTPLLVNWSGYDPGGSGILGYDLQYRESSSNTWIDWLDNVSIRSAYFTGVLGSSYSFRIRATDLAMNVEPWSVAGNPSTILVTWGVYGKAVDNHGVPVSDMLITTNPPAFGFLPGNSQGDYGAYVLDKMDSYSAEWSKAGYGTLPLTSFIANQSRQLNISLPPEDNIIPDWGMESGGIASDWHLGGVYTPVITATIRHTGDYGLLFPAPQVGFSDPETLYSDYLGQKQIVIGPDGTIHVLWSAGANSQVEVYYSQHPLGGTWSPPVNVSHTPDNSELAKVVVDSTGALHVIWTQVYEWPSLNLYYSRRDPDGIWSEPLSISVPTYNSTPEVRALVDPSGVLHILCSTYNITSDSHVYYLERFSDGSWSDIRMLSTTNYAINPDFVMDENGLLHAIWSDYIAGVLYYSYKDAAGDWFSPVQLATDQRGIPRLAADNTGTIHVVYEDGSSRLNYRFRQGGAWSPSETFPSYGMPDYLSLLAELDGQVNVLWKDSYENIYFRHRSLAGIWTDPFRVGITGSYPDMALDGNGGLDVVWSDSVLYFNQRASDGAWSGQLQLTPTGSDTTDPQIAVDSFHQAHMIYSAGYTNLNYIGPGPVLQSGTGEASQVISVQNSLIAPTLSFWYQASGVSPAGNTWFDVQVQDQTGITEAFRTDVTSSDWTHQWINMTNWSGQAITLTYRLHQQAGSNPVSAYLDEVTLGSAHADVWVTLSGGTQGVKPGDQLTFQLDSGNRGGALAAGAAITLTLPVELSYINASKPPEIIGDQLVWQLGDLPAGSTTDPLQVTVGVNPSIQLGQMVTTTAEISSHSSELEQLNNISRFSTYLGYYHRLPIVRR